MVAELIEEPGSYTGTCDNCDGTGYVARGSEWEAVCVYCKPHAGVVQTCFCPFPDCTSWWMRGVGHVEEAS